VRGRPTRTDGTVNYGQASDLPIIPGMVSEIALGVIGAGRIGRLHAENLSRRIAGARVAAIADPDTEAARRAATDGTRVMVDPRELLDDPGIDAVVVCSPTDTHAPLLEAAATRGKHVFCEKPIDLDLDRAVRAARALERAGVVFQVGFNRRFDPSFRRVAELVRAGEIGAPHLVRISSRDPAPPPPDYVRASGGLFLDMSIHDLDMARFVAGDEVVEVFAAASVLVDPVIGAAGDVDTAGNMLRFRGGAIGLIDNSRRAVYGYDQRVEVFGAKGCLGATNPTPTEVSLWNEHGRRSDRLMQFFLERYRESYVAEMETFVSCVREGREAPVSGRDGVKAIELALAAGRSRREARPVRVGAE
jgi:myo-inositol 2-dehydrogenase/D-chiro-inositol 1-dehydrogenase